MKRTPFTYHLIFLSLLLFFGCTRDDGPDCFKKQGKEEIRIIAVGEFDQISISPGVSLTVKQGEEQSVELRMGKNLIGNIEFDVEDGELKIRNNANCDILSNYHPARVYVTTPVLSRIYSSSQYEVYSDGIWTFPNLSLESGISESVPSTFFEAEIENESLRINDNVSAVYKIKGNTNFLELRFWGGNGRLEAGDLKADSIDVFHRSTNDLIVYPLEKISGKIMSTGNLVLKNVPPIIEVEQIYTGHIVYP